MELLFSINLRASIVLSKLPSPLGSILKKWTHLVDTHYNKVDTNKEVSTYVHK